MAKRRKAKKRRTAEKRRGTALPASTCSTTLLVIESRKGGDPDTSYAARLFSRGRRQIAKKLGEEAVEALIEGIRGDRPKLVAESADVLYHLLALWACSASNPSGVGGARPARGSVGHRREGRPQAQVAATQGVAFARRLRDFFRGPSGVPMSAYDRNNIFARILRAKMLLRSRRASGLRMGPGRSLSRRAKATPAAATCACGRPFRRCPTGPRGAPAPPTPSWA